MAADYDAVLRSKLTTRLLGLLRLLALLIFALQNTLIHFNVFSLLSLLYTAWTTAACLPLIILNKQMLTTTPQLAINRLANLSRCTQKATYLTLAAYPLSGAMMVSAFTSLKNIHLFLEVPHLKIIQINPSYIYLFSSSFLLSCIIASRHVLLNESRLKYPLAEKTSIPQRSLNSFRQRFLNSTLSLVVAVNALHLLAWIAIRRPLLKFLVYHTVFRPYFATLYRHLNLSSSLLFSSLILNFYMAIVWDLTNSLFNTYMTQPIWVSPLTPPPLDPNAILLQGLTSAATQQRKFLAFLELATLVKFDRSRRVGIYKDVGTSGGFDSNLTGKQPAFEALTGECLKFLNTQKETAAKRGEVPVQSPNPPASTNDQVAPIPSFPLVSIKQGNIVKPVKPNFFDRLAKTQTDLPPFTPPPTSAPHSQGRTQPSASDSPIPKILQTPTSTPSKPPFSQTQAKNRPALKSQSVVSILPSSHLYEVSQFLLKKVAPHSIKNAPFMTWLVNSNPSVQVEKMVPHPMTSIWCVETLSTLLLCSLQEDQFGIAQKSLIKILEALIQMAEVLEGVVKELRSSVSPQDEEEMQKALQEGVQPLLETIRASIRSIVHAFEPYLGEFKMPQKIHHTLQAYMQSN